MDLVSTLLTLIALICAIAVYLLRRRMSYWQRRGISNDEPHILRGNFDGLKTKFHFHDIYKRFYDKYKGSGPFAGFYFFQSPVAFILDLKLAKNILIKDFTNFTDRLTYYNEKDDPLSAHLFALNGEKWKPLRHKLSPTFTSGKMKFMFPTVVKVCDQFVDVFAELLKTNATVEVKELFARFTTDVIGTCAFGIDCNSLHDPNAEFRIMGRRSFTERKHSNILLGLALSFPRLGNFLGITVFPNDITKFFMNVVRETVAYREQHNIKRNDFMDILIELKHKSESSSKAEDKLSIEELAAQAFVFFLAGFETSSTTSSFALYELARHQEVQDKVRAEITEVLAKHNNEFTYECMKDMRYLDQVISETLRLYTIVPALFRRCLKDYPIPDNPNYVIEAGTPVLIPASAIHRDPDYYPNPDEFNPDNFLPDNVQARDSTTWLPFGDGPRNCIGLRFGKMQSRIGLALLVKNFKFSIAPETAVPIELDITNSLVSSKGGIFLKVETVKN